EHPRLRRLRIGDQPLRLRLTSFLGSWLHQNPRRKKKLNELRRELDAIFFRKARKILLKRLVRPEHADHFQQILVERERIELVIRRHNPAFVRRRLRTHLWILDQPRRNELLLVPLVRRLGLLERSFRTSAPFINILRELIARDARKPLITLHVELFL